ncbi:MAG: hypothetical protein M1822_009210 [Bathelium mastoideum]|nr:MAG: hypothetical protein M1822_009210 [Bathelium mastoideum]
MSWQGKGGEAYSSSGKDPTYFDSPGSSQGRTEPTQVNEDEALARELQKQFDLESQESQGRAPTGQASFFAGSSSQPAHPSAPAPFSAQSFSSPEQDDDQSFNPMLAAAPLHGTDYTTDLASLQAFAKQVSQVGCVQCKKMLLHSKITPQDIAKPWFDKKHVHSNSAIRCSKCSVYTCIGCGTASTEIANNKTASGDCPLTWCCDQGRLFIIWVLLCLFDQYYLNATARNQSKASGSSKTFQPILPGGSKAGTGYGGSGSSRFGASWLSSLGLSESRFKASADAIDNITKQVTNFLEIVWPGSPENTTGPFDTQPPPVLLTMVSNSFLLDRTAILLRNDSIDDVAKRADLYDKVLSWIGAVGSHPFTANLVVNERTTKTDGFGLLQISFGRGPSTAKGKGKDEKSPSIANCLENLATQSEMLVKNLEKSKAKQSEATQITVNICNGILLVAHLLNKYMPIQVVAPRNPANAWEQWQRDKAVNDIPDQEMMNQHVWAKHARSLSHSPKDRIPRIVRELANLKTSLPPGVFVRHATNRVDIWKVLIIGPSGTPYENGLFEFDVFFPGSYPKEPPSFYFVAAGRYRIGINPNLHADGKVCLSLLNTWPGPNWNPAHSTPLQILVSIQAMIFCEQPWYNEPGREEPRVSSNAVAVHVSHKYNAVIRVHVVQYCMLPWLQAQGIWGEIVAKHLRTNKQQILVTTQQWVREQAHWSGREMADFGLGVGPQGFGSMGTMMTGSPMVPGMGPLHHRTRPLRETVQELQQLLSII